MPVTSCTVVIMPLTMPSFSCITCPILRQPKPTTHHAPRTTHHHPALRTIYQTPYSSNGACRVPAHVCLGTCVCARVGLSLNQKPTWLYLNTVRPPLSPRFSFRCGCGVVSGEGFIAVYGYAGFSEGVRLVGVPCGVALIRGKEKGVGCMQ